MNRVEIILLRRVRKPSLLASIVFLICTQPILGQAQPSIVLFPTTTVPAGNTIHVGGEGFINSCGVDILLDSPASDPLLSSVNVDSSGSFSVQLNLLRATSMGEHEIVARGLRIDVEFCGKESSGDTAMSPIAVSAPLPILISEITDTTPGAVTKLQGAGFCSDPGCSAVQILIDGLVVAEDITVDDNGAFSVDAMVPAVVAAGEVAVIAVQQDADGDELRAFDSIVVTVRPNSNAPRPNGPTGPG